MFKKRGRIFAGILAVMLAFSSGGISALADEPEPVEEQTVQTPEEPEENKSTKEVGETEDVKEVEETEENEEIKEVEETEKTEEIKKVEENEGTATRTETDEEDNLQNKDSVRDIGMSETEKIEAENLETEETITENINTDSIETFSANPGNLESAKVQGESPQGTTINLFDYWQDTQDASDATNYDLVSGINAGTALKFGKGMGQTTDLSPQHLNAWTESEAVRQGIVQRVLTEDGYPQLTETASPNETVKDLSYLFSPSVEHEGKASYPGAEGLLQVDAKGYYYYDSRQTFAEYDEGTRQFNLYEGSYTSDDGQQVGGAVTARGSSPDGQFFPFNKAEAVYNDNDSDGVTLNPSINSVNQLINHYFGMTMSTRFFQQNGGKTTDGKSVTYEFAGDDDVWVFIDDVLVADLGGIHDRAELEIDFSTGDIIINDGTRDGEKSTLKAQFQAARKVGNESEWRDNTFADNTYHTLSFFYLERGNTDSNLYLKFNLVTLLESGVIKVDQAGKKIEGAEFALYEAENVDGTYSYDKYAKPICSGTTNDDGELIFRNPDDGSPISLSSIYAEGAVQYLVLKEETIPSGYRSAGEMHLRFEKAANGEVFLLSENHWDTGAYAATKVTANTDATIKLYKSQEEVNLNEVSGTLFAVVMQRQDMNQSVEEETNWRPVYGNPLNGWHVVQAEDEGVMGAVLKAARANPYVFKHPQENSSLYTADIENLPGDIRKYYFVLNKYERNDAEYTVGYYYTKAATLADATTRDTYRVDTTGFGRNFSANLYVPNIQNNLYVQKLDEDGVPVSVGGDSSRSAKFTLYPKKNVSINKDGTYEVENSEGSLQVNTSDMDTPLPLTGGAMFRGIPNGEYYLIETKAPAGYEKSKNIVKVDVNSTGVYANAGIAGDGITVERGVGSIVHSMLQFAANDDVDKTLHDIKTKLYTADETTLPDYSANSWTENTDEIHFQFQEGEETLNYRMQGSNEYGYYTIDAGWSKLKILQCTNEDHATMDRKQELNNQDLTQLFSGTVVVQVKNESVGELTISKKVVNNTGVDATEPEDGFSFTLTGTKEDNTNLSGMFNAIRTSGGSTQMNEKVVFSGGTATIKLKNDESLTLKGLPEKAKMGVAENTYTDYETTYKNVTDTGQPGQTEGVTDLTPIEIQQRTAHKVEVTNTYHLEGDFTFKKIERTVEGEQAKDNPLSGAVFAVYKLECTQSGSPSGDAGHDHEDELISIEDPKTGAVAGEDKGCWELVGTPITSGPDGVITISGIPVIENTEYRLAELQAPPGFTRPQGQWKLEYDADGKKFIPVTGTPDDPNSASVGNPPAIEEASGDGTTTTYKIRNYRPGELPFSGNTGIRMFLLLGGGLMLLGAAGGCGWYVHKRHHTVRRRRRVRRR